MGLTPAQKFPGNWTWATDVLRSGPIVVVDVDGVIADGWHRQHYLRGGQSDWHGFFAAAADDTPIAGAAEMLRVMSPDVGVVLLTARPHTLYEITLDWIRTHRFRWDALIMRARSDGGLSSPDFKKRSLHELRDHGYEPLLALDDDQRNIDMFRDEAVPALYVHSGYYEA